MSAEQPRPTVDLIKRTHLVCAGTGDGWCGRDGHTITAGRLVCTVHDAALHVLAAAVALLDTATAMRADADDLADDTLDLWSAPDGTVVAL